MMCWAAALGACALAAIVFTVATRDGDPGRLGVHLPGGTNPRAAAGLLWKLRAVKGGATVAGSPLQAVGAP